MDENNDKSAVNPSPVVEGRMEQLEYWLTNVFWFHYKWYFIATVFGITLIILAIAGTVTNVNYDWTVVYAHTGASDSVQTEKLQKLLESVLPETGKNRSVDVKVIDLYHGDDALSQDGEYKIYNYLNDQNSIIFVVDDSFLKTFTSLGYLSDAAPITSTDGLYAATNDSPVKPLSKDDEQYSDYSQEFLDGVYDEYVADHQQYLDEAHAALGQICG